MKLILSFLLILGLLCNSLRVMSQIQPVKIKNLRGKPIVQVELNGKKAYFLLDTGSDLTVMHEDIADFYNFNIKEMVIPLKVAGVDGSTGGMNRASNIELKLGELSILTPYFSYDLSSVIKYIQSKTFLTISGIIGSDVMVKYGFVIDYGEELVYIERADPSAG
ncbi:aspartyl protease family protein [Catalinimonas niigatensis]|uniref:aspartyl protease family protein n=1 Tax=Catalinimonas niigatensis TaxID=1397264 RepID=UPI0026667EFB|nr:aspartyl protease family protein [Catalinimonas niigatensis]WPP53275.1 aspartyl protease family protein [Catalinimonas niigatensis]